MRRTPQQPGEAQAPQAAGELEESCEDSTGGGGAAHRLVTAQMCTCARLFDEALRIHLNREPVACEEASATSNQRTPSAPPQGSSQLPTSIHRRDVYQYTPSRLFLPILGGWAACGVAPLIDRERRVGCSMDSSYELLSSLQTLQARPFTPAKCIAAQKHGREVSDTLVLIGFAFPGR
jgi:hypothetical protein